MLMMQKRLPQLDPLIAFDAAARHASFLLASKELNVTASAVSQQIRNLETQLGVSLFNRGHRSVQLTERGKDFHTSVSFALTHLAGATDEVRNRDGAEQLVIATDTSIAAQWLIPRLERFEALYPDISLRIKVTDVQAGLLNETFQIALVHGDGELRGYVTELLFEEEVFPVCAPGYLEQWEGTFTARDLARAKLLDLDYEQWHWMNWAIWLSEMALPPPNAPRKLRMNNYPILIDAAKRGAGIALGWRYLVDDDLDRGLLIKPVKESVKTKYGYHIAWPYNDNMSHAVASFKEWLDTERNV